MDPKTTSLTQYLYQASCIVYNSIDYACFYDFSTGFWDYCSECVVYFVFIASRNQVAHLDTSSTWWKESLNSVGQQVTQYQQNNHIQNSFNTQKTTKYDVSNHLTYDRHNNVAGLNNVCVHTSYCNNKTDDCVAICVWIWTEYNIYCSIYFVTLM